MSEVFTVLDGMVTTNYLTQLFRKSALTIMYWRKHEQLPYVMIPGEGRNTIRFRLDEVSKWALTRKKRIYLVDQEAVQNA